MSSIFASLPELFLSYKKWVSSHPELASDFETTAKWVSYFITGRINNSILSELVYSLSNLLVLLNDRIISDAQKLDIPGSGDKLKVWLTVLEYSEVFLELSAMKLWGEFGKWAVIVILQLFKCISRLFLLFSHKENIITNPPIPILKRKKLTAEYNYTTDFDVEEARTRLELESFVLRRSGKVIRKVEGSPSIENRKWIPFSIHNNNENNFFSMENKIMGQQLLAAETCYILKPIAHLGLLFYCGKQSWKPWMLALLMDITSQHLYQNAPKLHMKSLSHKQQLELSRRNLALVLYLLRTPFYEKYSKDRIQSYLKVLTKIPFSSMIFTPLAQYIPQWQKTYFYMWST